MNLKNKLRHYWHDFFYAVVPRSGVRLAMRCQDVAEEVNLHQRRKSVMGYFRFYLHLSLCQACANYNKTSLILREALRKMIGNNNSQKQIERLNQELLTKFTHLS